MKHKILSIALVSALGLSGHALAMDIERESLNYTSETQRTSITTYEAPSSGLYISAEYALGKSGATATAVAPNSYRTYSFAVPAQKQTMPGLAIGYQTANIYNTFLQALQVKRLSYELEFQASKQTVRGIATNNAVYAPQLTMNNTNQDIMLNFKANVFKLWRFSPYLSAGVGLAKENFSYQWQISDKNFAMDTAKKTNMAYQFGAGVDMFVFSHWNVSAGYRYFNAGRISGVTSGATTVQQAPVFSTKENQLVMSLRYNF